MNTVDSISNTELPILESEEQYKSFVRSIDEGNSSILLDHPEGLPGLTSRNENYLNKLNYQFLELDGKEKFLRYLNLGSILKKDEISGINKENERLSLEMKKQREEVDELKREVNMKSEKVIKIIVKECKKRNETTRQLESEVERLEQERDRLNAEMNTEDSGFEGKGLEELKKMEIDASDEITRLTKELGKLKGEEEVRGRRLNGYRDEEKKLREERERLKRDIKEWGPEREYNEEEEKKIKEMKYLKSMIGAWNELTPD